MHLSSLLNGAEPSSDKATSSEALRQHRPEDSLPSPQDSLAGPRDSETITQSRRQHVGGGVYSLPLPIQTKQAALEHSQNKVIKPLDGGENWENGSLPTFGSWNHSPGRTIAAEMSNEAIPLSCDEEQRDAQHERHAPRHKLSDSQSSVVSYCSSYSGAHSRTSSVTTVSDSGLMAASVTETLPPITKLDPVREETPSPDGTDAHSHDNFITNFTFQVEGGLTAPDFASEASRPKSCSNISKFPQEPAESPTRTLSTLRQPLKGLSLTSKLHKRAASAPALTRTSLAMSPLSKMAGRDANSAQVVFAAGQGVTSDRFPGWLGSPKTMDEDTRTEVLSPASSRASVSSSAPEPSSTTSHIQTPAKESPQPEVDTEEKTKPTPKDAISCMFIDKCDTGAQLRKAISHFFGRNKGCTLLIPNHIWVHYCRKHYQRVRYRNAKEYPRTQMDLVKAQVLRLRDWSLENEAQGQGRVIKDWTFALRKREQQRLQEAIEASAASGNPVSLHADVGEAATAVPQWVYASLGDGYSTDQILELVERFYAELSDGTLEQIPEVEFLPNIIDDGKDTAIKTARPRKTSKRKATEETELGDDKRLTGHEHPYFGSMPAATAKRARAQTYSYSPSRRNSEAPSLGQPMPSTFTVSRGSPTSPPAGRGSGIVLPSLGRPQQLSGLGDRYVNVGGEASLPPITQLEVKPGAPASRSQQPFLSPTSQSTPRDPFYNWANSPTSTPSQTLVRYVAGNNEDFAVQRWLDSDGPSSYAVHGQQTGSNASPVPEYYMQQRHHSIPPVSEHHASYEMGVARPRMNTYSTPSTPAEHSPFDGRYVHGYGAVTSSNHATMQPAVGGRQGAQSMLLQVPRQAMHTRNLSAPMQRPTLLSPTGTSSRPEYFSPYPQSYKPAGGGRRPSHSRSASLRSFSTGAGASPRDGQAAPETSRPMASDRYEAPRC